MTYAEKLKDPRWQKKRLKILERDEFMCRHCGDNNNTLHVHHIGYSKGDPWETKDDLLITLCSVCHENETEELKGLYSTAVNELRNTGFMSSNIRTLLWMFTVYDRNIHNDRHAAETVEFLLKDDRAWQCVHQWYLSDRKERMEKAKKQYQEEIKGMTEDEVKSLRPF